MQAYIVRRLLWAIPVFVGAITLVFLVMNVLPGDIAMIILGAEGGQVDPLEYEILREQLGLNVPLYQQYFNWIGGVFRGDLGTSIWTGQPVWFELSIRFPYTAALVILSIALTIIIGIPVGIIAAVNQDNFLDYGLRGGLILGISIPNFYLSILLLLLVVNVWGWYPPLEYATLWTNPGVAIQQYAMPALMLGIRSSARIARMTRSSMLEVLREDFVRTARAKGLYERTVIYVHALRNALLPVMTVIGMQLGFLMGGTVIIETIFRVPGIGSLLMNGINRRDIPIVEGVVVLIVIIVLITNLLVDVLYGWLDPRIRYR